MTNLQKEDVLSVAKSIDKTVTNEQVERILNEYEVWEKQDPTATWNLIIEDMIYFVLFDENTL